MAAGPIARCENFSWTWLRQTEGEGGAANVVVQDQDNLSVLFHPNYSSGTAAVRGDTALVRPFHYYWEVKMMRPVYGTDVIVGLATKDLDLSLHSNNFASLIGSDKHSWGYSFHGYVQHDGQQVLPPLTPSLNLISMCCVCRGNMVEDGARTT